MPSVSQLVSDGSKPDFISPSLPRNRQVWFLRGPSPWFVWLPAVSSCGLLSLRVTPGVSLCIQEIRSPNVVTGQIGLELTLTTSF